MTPVEFKPTAPTNKRPQSYALDRVATGIGCFFLGSKNLAVKVFKSFEGFKQIAVLYKY
jgi:hypothetical protein